MRPFFTVHSTACIRRARFVVWFILALFILLAYLVFNTVPTSYLLCSIFSLFIGLFNYFSLVILYCYIYYFLIIRECNEISDWPLNLSTGAILAPLGPYNRSSNERSECGQWSSSLDICAYLVNYIIILAFYIILIK